MLSWISVCMLLVSFPTGRSTNCLSIEQGHLAKRHFKLYDDSWSLLPLKLSYSRRPSNQITTHVLRTLLEEVLGYDGVVLVPDNSGLSVGDALQKLTGCQNYSCQSNAVPNVMVNTEVWIPPGYHINQWVDNHLVDNAGIITDHGRFGWYMPSEFVYNLWHDNKTVADYWRSLGLRSVSGQLMQNMTTLKSFIYLPELKDSCEKLSDCHGGWLYGSNCDPKLDKNAMHCTVLLADYPDHHGSVVGQQINNLDLNVTVVWLGSNLGKVISSLVNHSFLLFNWEPNVVTKTRQMTRINFPVCSDGVSFVKSLVSEPGPFNCDFPHTHLRKLAWGKIKQNAPDVYHTLSRMYFDRETMNTLLKKHIDGGGNLTSKEVACDWLQHSREIWLPWLPPGTLDRIPVFLGGMFPLSTSDDAVWSRPGILQGALMALERINEDLRVLRNYSLRLIVKDTQCKTALILNAFIEFMSRYHNETLVGIVGPACSVQTEIIAEVAPLYNTVVMGYSVEGVSLADRERFPLFFRTSPSYAEFKFAYATVFDFFDWRQFASLTDNNYESSTVTGMHEYLESKGMHLAYSRLIANQNSIDIKTYMASLKRSTAKIIIATLFESLARAVICEAVIQEMTSQNGYVWFLPAWLAEDWWHIDDSTAHGHSTEGMLEVPCSHEDMEQFVKSGYFSLSIAFYGPELSTVQGGGTVGQWKEEYEKRVLKQGHSPSGYASFAYDAVWAYALAMDKLFTSYPAALDTIHTDNTTHLLKSFLQQTNFTGVSGRVIFRDGERYLPTVEMNQHFPTSVVTVGRVVPDTLDECGGGRGCLYLNESHIQWYGGSRPSDGRSEPSTHVLCSVESFRNVLGVSCTGALAVINSIAIGLFLIVVIAFIWICIKRRYDRKYKETQQRMEELGLMKQSPVLHLDEWEIPRENIVLNRKLGEGAFGAVCGGEVSGIKGEEDWVPVAVKSLKIGSLPEDKLEFLSEAETMKIFDHKNIVKLLGVCTKGEPSFAVMELMIHGDLKSFLLARRQFANRDCKEAEDVTPVKLTTMGLDIASGLEYLASMKFVHRDLALRNCMVGPGYVVKLGDFGMARAMYDSDYYRFGRRAMLPVRWMAPESLADGVFTTKSDIWGLGVTLWELATFGSFPYQGLSNGEVIEKVKQGQTMDKPHGCTDELEALLTECWRKTPDHRPEPNRVIDLLSTHRTMITACLDSPMSSVATDDDCVEPRDISKGSMRTGRGTPSPSLRRSRTISQVTNEQLRAVIPVKNNAGVPVVQLRSYDKSNMGEDSV